MPLEAGRLRHYIDIERLKKERDPATGAFTTRWAVEFADVPVAIEPATSKEYMAASAMQAEVTTRIVMRFIPGLNATQRFVHGRQCCKDFGEEIFNPTRPLRDKDSGLEFVVFPCSHGVNNG